ncbi:MAG TPA: hemerythrin domain-containing protein [Streptosporangiaceae bacterium]
MSDGEKSRLIAWDRELAAAHQRLRAALRLARDAPGGGNAASARADLALYCRGFCAALSGHHGSEDRALFPGLAARHPGLRPVIATLRQDHEVIASLIRELDRALASGATPAGLAPHLDGISAIMESHFRYEERQLLGALADLELSADPHALLGPL